MKIKLLTYVSLIFTMNTMFSQNFVKSTIDGSTLVEPYTIASGHLNGDAYLDIAIGSDTGSAVEWYKNNGDGTFTDMGTLTAIAPADLSYVEGMEIADIDGDGDGDILATSYVNDNLVWFENNGDETFQNAVEITDAINGAGTVKVVNIDNDVNGYLDVVLTAYEGNSVMYMLGNGDGTFGILRFIAPVTGGSGPGNVDLADFDGDGDLDAIVAFTGNGEVKLYDNKLIPDGIDGSGNVPFVPYDNLVDSGNGFLWTVSFADIDDDSDLDIIKSDNSPGGMDNIAWYSADASGTATTFTEHNVSTSISRSAMASVADLNNDTYNDLLVTNGRVTDDDYIWFTSDAISGLGSEIIIDNTSSTGFDIEIQDFDNDGDLDIAGISYLQNDLSIFLNDLITLGIEDQSIGETISIFPNPTNNVLNFKTPTTENFNISIYNVLGKKVISKTIENNKALDVTNLANGVYIIRFDDYNQTYKFIKE